MSWWTVTVKSPSGSPREIGPIGAATAADAKAQAQRQVEENLRRAQYDPGYAECWELAAAVTWASASSRLKPHLYWFPVSARQEA